MKDILKKMNFCWGMGGGGGGGGGSAGKNISYHSICQ